MTSYRVKDIADVDPAFGVQLHHPRFLECIGVPESARLLGRSPAEWVRMMNWQDVMAVALELHRDAGLAYGFESAGVGSICDVTEPDVVGGAPLSLQTRSIPGAHGQRRGPGAPGAPRGHPEQQPALYKVVFGSVGLDLGLHKLTVRTKIKTYFDSTYLILYIHT